MIDEVLLFLGEHSSNPYIRSATILAGALGYQKIVEKAKIISAKAEQRREDRAIRDERESIWEYVDDEYDSLKSELWKGISEWKHTMRDAGISQIVIDERSNTLSGKSVNEYKIDYNGAMKDIRDRIKRKYTRKIKTAVRMGKTGHHIREETVARISSQMRRTFFDELHKICGVNKQVEDMEQKYAGLEFFDEMTSDIMYHIEEVSAIREIEIENLRKEHSVKTFDLKKIYRTLFHK